MPDRISNSMILPTQQAQQTTQQHDYCAETHLHIFPGLQETRGFFVLPVPFSLSTLTASKQVPEARGEHLVVSPLPAPLRLPPERPRPGLSVGHPAVSTLQWSRPPPRDGQRCHDIRSRIAWHNWSALRCSYCTHVRQAESLQANENGKLITHAYTQARCRVETDAPTGTKKARAQCDRSPFDTANGVCVAICSR